MGVSLLSYQWRESAEITEESGGDTAGGNTRSHAEHDG